MRLLEARAFLSFFLFFEKEKKKIEKGRGALLKVQLQQNLRVEVGS